ncbi:hypothetical protein, partial [Pseudomonas aeruginosa]
TTLLDNRLILNGNLFWTVVNGYQANAYDEANRTQYLTNAGDVRSRGLEGHLGGARGVLVGQVANVVVGRIEIQGQAADRQGRRFELQAARAH